MQNTAIQYAIFKIEKFLFHNKRVSCLLIYFRLNGLFQNENLGGIAEYELYELYDVLL